MPESWETGWLCKGCGRALASSHRDSLSGRLEQIIEANKDANGDFFRCTHCGAKHYYVTDAKGEPAFRNFVEGPPLYWLKRRLGIRTT